MQLSKFSLDRSFIKILTSSCQKLYSYIHGMKVFKQIVSDAYLVKTNYETKETYSIL